MEGPTAGLLGKGESRVRPALVTGATGFVGWHVARRLLERGEPLRVFVRAPSRLRELEEVEVVTGDLRDPVSVRRAVAGCRVVYHVAADYRLWARWSEELYRSNIDGTRNILEAAGEEGVERIVYTSTVGCIGIPAGGIGEEQTPVSLDDMAGHYKRSKFLAEQAALELAAQGLPVVIVNPTAPVGDHDFKPTPTGKTIVDYLRGVMRAYLDTGLNLVDVRDVAEGHWLACQYGRPGARYILGCQNLTLKEIFQKLEAISGVPAPALEIPYAVAFGAGVITTGWAYLTGRPPLAPLEGVRMARKKMFVSQDKAVRELGYAPSPVEGALARAVEWFRSNDYC